jgi:hypothetical protein
VSITQVPISTPSSIFEFTDTAIGNTADAIKSSSAVLYWLLIDNSANAGAATYVKLYNLAAGSVTVGTTVPDEVVYCPASSRITHVFYTNNAPGKTFGTALSACAVTTGGTAGTVAASSSVIFTAVYV